MKKEPTQILSKKEWIRKISRSPLSQICVNRKWGPQLKDHAVLRKLLKSGVLRRIRSGYGKCKYTTLELNK